MTPPTSLLCTQELLSDANPMVVANALAALQEIQEVSGRDMLQLNQNTLMKLLTALNDCTEWGQVRTQTGGKCALSPLIPHAMLRPH